MLKAVDADHHFNKLINTNLFSSSRIFWSQMVVYAHESADSLSGEQLKTDILELQAGVSTNKGTPKYLYTVNTLVYSDQSTPAGKSFCHGECGIVLNTVKGIMQE